MGGYVSLTLEVVQSTGRSELSDGQSLGDDADHFKNAKAQLGVAP
jgi:hypothetical protein